MDGGVGEGGWAVEGHPWHHMFLRVTLTSEPLGFF